MREVSSLDYLKRNELEGASHPLTNDNCPADCLMVAEPLLERPGSQGLHEIKIGADGGTMWYSPDRYDVADIG